MTAIGSTLPVPARSGRDLPVVELTGAGGLLLREPEASDRRRRREGEREASSARPRETPLRTPLPAGWRPEDAAAAYRTAVFGGPPAPLLDILA
jgi:hypothetical protein